MPHIWLDVKCRYPLGAPSNWTRRLKAIILFFNGVAGLATASTRHGHKDVWSESATIVAEGRHCWFLSIKVQFGYLCKHSMYHGTGSKNKIQRHTRASVRDQRRTHLRTISSTRKISMPCLIVRHEGIISSTTQLHFPFLRQGSPLTQIAI